MHHVTEVLEKFVLPQLRGGIRAIIPDTATPVLSTETERFALNKGIIARDAYAWSWMLRGEAPVKINDIIYSFAPGDFYFLPPLTTHSDLYDLDTQPNEALWFISTPRELIYGHNSYTSSQKLEVVAFGNIHAPTGLGSVLVALHREISGNAPHSDPIIQGLVLQLAGHIMRAMEEADRSRRPSPQDPLSTRVLAYLRAHYTEDLTLAQIAGITYFTPTYLAAVFKKETGQTIFEALAEIRINHAATLLRAQRMPVSLVATTVGYRNVDQFSRVFRRITGATPSRYRQDSAC